MVTGIAHHAHAFRIKHLGIGANPILVAVPGHLQILIRLAQGFPGHRAYCRRQPNNPEL